MHNTLRRGVKPAVKCGQTFRQSFLKGIHSVVKNERRELEREREVKPLPTFSPLHTWPIAACSGRACQIDAYALRLPSLSGHSDPKREGLHCTIAQYFGHNEYSSRNAVVIVLPHDAVLQQQFSNGQLFFLNVPAFFLSAPSAFTPPLCLCHSLVLFKWMNCVFHAGLKSLWTTPWTIGQLIDR